MILNLNEQIKKVTKLNWFRMKPKKNTRKNRLTLWRKLKQTLQKTKIFIYRKCSVVKLFIDNIKSTEYKDFKVYKLSDEKTLDVVFIDWLFDYPLKFLAFGLILTLGWTFHNSFIGLWILVSIGLWLSFKVLWEIKGD